MRTFVFEDDKSHKFWNITLQGTNFTVTFGKVGTTGQTQTKTFADAAKARKEHDKLVAEKLKKGYTETTAPAPEAVVAEVTPLQRSLEDALVENPDDLATHSAYADYLNDQGDPRGEFIQVQLALENAALPAKERTRLQKREAALLAEHARTWLGDVGRFLVGDWSGPEEPFHYEFRRGWLDLVRVLPAPDAILASLARCPEARLLSRLEIVYDMRYHPFEFDLDGPNAALTEDEDKSEIYEGADLLPPLLESPYLTNLRTFKLGYSDFRDRIAHSTMISVFENCTAQEVITLLAKNPRIEELYLNTALTDIAALFALPSLNNLRVLQYYYGSSYLASTPSGTYPLDVLVENPSLTNLTTLRLHPGRDETLSLEQVETILRARNLPALQHLQLHMTTLGDAGPRAVVDSGILHRLTTLDLGYGTMTDAGAQLLAACPDLKHLETLDVTRNALTEAGIDALQATGITIVAENQHGGGDENEFLYEVDFE